MIKLVRIPLSIINRKIDNSNKKKLMTRIITCRFIADNAPDCGKRYLRRPKNEKPSLKICVKNLRLIDKRKKYIFFINIESLVKGMKTFLEKKSIFSF